ncbi:uncharacterized protein LOC135199226 isoform X2 [Macrobrachium nipponense]|uniref:uncharacterized protein LOC135199226 isoform X2 n=1 Tax=Macrobrachium nipponense TaxID=159736 RepID=UPI0030C80F82
MECVQEASVGGGVVVEYVAVTCLPKVPAQTVGGVSDWREDVRRRAKRPRRKPRDFSRKEGDSSILGLTRDEEPSALWTSWLHCRRLRRQPIPAEGGGGTGGRNSTNRKTVTS